MSKITLNNVMINNYRELVDSNCYSELLVTVASDFNLDYYKKLFKAILDIHSIEGSISFDVREVRTRLKDEMLNYFSYHLSENDYNTIRQFV